MRPLFERFRPRTLDEVVGQDKAVGQIRRIIAQSGFGGRAVWVSGASGIGKTTLARIIAGTVADPSMTTEYDSADEVGMDELRSIREQMGMFGWGIGGRAWIVNESHGLRAPVIRGLLGLIENLPAHCAMIFTTTKSGEEKLFEDAIDASPLLSRCIQVTLTNQGLARAFAERVRTIAQAEGLDGQPVEAYVKLMQRPDVKNNCRAALNLIESGVMIGGSA